MERSILARLAEAPGPAAGLVSQALANLQATKQQVTGLAASTTEPLVDAAPVVALIDQIVAAVSGMQQKVQQFLQLATPLANTALTALDGPDPGQAKATITQLRAAAVDLGPAVAGVSATVATARNQADAFLQDIATQQTKLTSEIADNQAKQIDLQAQADDLSKQVALLEGLATFFGAPGLAELQADLLNTAGEEQEVEAYISQLQATASLLASLKVAYGQLSADLQAVAEKFQALKSSVDYVSADNQILVDFSDAAKRAAAKLYLTAITAQLKTLAGNAA